MSKIEKLFDANNPDKDAKGAKKKKEHTKMAIHVTKQFYRDSKQLTLYSDEIVENYASDTGIKLTNKPEGYGVILNQSQSRVFEGILKAFTETNYRGEEERDKFESLGKVVKVNSGRARDALSTPYKNIDTIPVIRLTQAELIERSGYDLKAQRQSDKQHVIEALNFLATNQFCFYWMRLKNENGKPVKNKRGDYVKEEVMEVGTLLRVKTVRNEESKKIEYYEIEPSAPILDQVDNYFLLVPVGWRKEVKELTGKRASSYTYELLLWLRLQYEQIRQYNKGGGKKRKPKPFKITKRWEDVAIALKMPKSMYKANRKRAAKIIQDAYSIAIKLGYLVKVEKSDVADTLYLNEDYYPKPGELV